MWTITIQDTIVFGTLQSNLMKMIKWQKLQWTPQIGLIFWQKTLCIKEVCSFRKNAIPMFTAAVVKRTDLLIRFLILPCITYKVITICEFSMQFLLVNN